MHALLLALALLAPPPPAVAPSPATADRAAPPRVLLRTAQGEIVIELDAVRAPATAANFLRYVEAGRYRGGAFHRTVTTT
ncbi:MAG TPA: peptidylprolyl isomerase, partial [Anaeromyxobacteraceae bacterium]|nr:peptidylprolyl isomerase [Anaeromyxobacteraceae bacterium]